MTFKTKRLPKADRPGCTVQPQSQKHLGSGYKPRTCTAPPRYRGAFKIIASGACWTSPVLCVFFWLACQGKGGAPSRPVGFVDRHHCVAVLGRGRHMQAHGSTTHRTSSSRTPSSRRALVAAGSTALVAAALAHHRAAKGRWPVSRHCPARDAKNLRPSG